MQTKECKQTIKINWTNVIKYKQTNNKIYTNKHTYKQEGYNKNAATRRDLDACDSKQPVVASLTASGYVSSGKPPARVVSFFETVTFWLALRHLGSASGYVYKFRLGINHTFLILSYLHARLGGPGILNNLCRRQLYQCRNKCYHSVLIFIYQ